MNGARLNGGMVEWERAEVKWEGRVGKCLMGEGLNGEVDIIRCAPIKSS